MKFLFLKSLGPLLLFSFAAQAQKTEALFLDAAILKLKHAKQYTMEMASLMPEDKYSFKANPVEMSFGGQLLHIASNMGWLCSSYLSTRQNPFSKEDAKLTNKKDILLALDKTYDFAIDVLQHFDANDLADTVSFFAGPMNKLQIINLLSDHQTHHQGQIIVYLRLNGIKPPDYVGW
ncbi:MAG: DinB family protein [Bacteroidota bacterium]|jgi:uncharacterized damage-inducible protein DinB|nr:DinB family protein [Bacteroidota bacterium]